MGGQVATMNSSFLHLGIGIVGAVVFVYLLLALLFQSWTDPFIILMALPGRLPALSGYCFSLRPPSMSLAYGRAHDDRSGDIQQYSSGCVRERFSADHQNAMQAALEAGSTRLRPVS